MPKFQWNHDALHYHTTCCQPLEDYGDFWYCLVCNRRIQDDEVCEEGP